MNYANPTYISIGQTAQYANRTWRVRGRAVLGVVEAGEIYFWHEFNLATDAGETSTLVFERTEHGAEWRWFIQFQPDYPLTAAEASAKEVGDQVNLEGTDLRVTRVDTSRIYFIEGQPPEGEHLGAEATYFNAERGPDMVVVSWTGDEVEYYRGRTLSVPELQTAFNLKALQHRQGVPANALNRLDLARQEVNPWPKMITWAVLGIVMVALLCFWLQSELHPTVRGNGIVNVPAPAAPLTLGATGSLGAVNYHVTRRAELAVAEQNLRFAQQEYGLRDDQGNPALLIAGFHPRMDDWVLFTRLTAPPELTPQKAAAMRLGQVVNVAGLVVPVGELFCTRVAATEAGEAAAPRLEDSQFGFTGERDGQILLVRWQAEGLESWKGRRVSNQTVRAAWPPAKR